MLDYSKDGIEQEMVNDQLSRDIQNKCAREQRIPNHGSQWLQFRVIWRIIYHRH